MMVGYGRLGVESAWSAPLLVGLFGNKRSMRTCKTTGLKTGRGVPARFGDLGVLGTLSSITKIY